MIKFLFDNWKYIALILTIVGLMGGVVLWRVKDIDHWKTAGYSQCQAENKAAKEAADEATRKEQNIIKKDTEKRKAKIYENANDDKPVGPLLNRYFDSLRNE